MAPKTSFDAIPRKLHIILAIIGMIGSGIFFVLLRPHWFWLAGAGFLSFLYTAPKFPLRFTQVLQKIAYGKTVFLTLAWTYITTMLPLLITDTAFDASHIIFCVNRFFLIYAICILFDLRDRNSDQEAGIKSIITNAPLPAVNRMYWGTLIVYFFTTLLLLFHFPISVIIAFLIPGIILSAGYQWFKKQQAEFVYNFILDGLMIFSLPLLLLFRF
ncbi:MAG TPA: hypothetical protein VM010_03865 [Chitinophagaceae bacterium]|nr:hypothetical protein [Chitinophagaceae bacterium]